MKNLPNQPQEPLNKKRERQALVLWRLAAIALILLHLFPIRFTILRALMVADAALLWCTLPMLFRNKAVRVVYLLASIGLLGIFAVGSSHSADPEHLSQQYVGHLKQYIGTRYIWAGENARGIDCSGLVRAGLIDTDLEIGVKKRNPLLLREGISLWWHDCSAKALKQQYRGNTIPVLDVASLNTADYSKILPGDICVTDSGEHTLAYLGDRVWIEADPVAGRVRTVAIPSSEGFFNREMRILRWRQLCR
jgi:NlpC/P60 family